MRHRTKLIAGSAVLVALLVELAKLTPAGRAALVTTATELG